MASIVLKANVFNLPDRAVLLFGLLVAVMPLGVDALTNLLLLVVLINTIVSSKAGNWRAALKHKMVLVPALFFFYYATTWFWASNTADGLTQLETKLSFLAVPVVVAANITLFRKSAIRWFKWSLIWGVIVTMIVAISIAVFNTLQAGQSFYLTETGQSISFFTYTQLANPFMHVGYLSTFVGVAIIVLIDEVIEIPKRRWLKLMALLALLIFMFLLQGRMNVLALFITGGITFLFYTLKYRAYKWFLLPIAAMLVTVIAVQVLPESLAKRYLEFPDFSYDITADATAFNSATYRLAEWKGAMQVIAAHPIFGVGVGDNRDELTKAYQELGFKVGVERHYNAHNQYLETTIASGLVGFLLLVFFMGSWIFALLRSKDWPSVFAMVFFMLCMLTESMLERAWAVIFLAVYFSLMVFSNRPAAADVKNKL